MLIVRCVESEEVQRKGFMDDLVKSHLKDLLSKETILIRKSMKGKKKWKHFWTFLWKSLIVFAKMLVAYI